MQLDKSVLCYGLGMNDPTRIFGASEGLVEEFGEERVFDMPTSENAMTGVGIGLAINGFRPVFSHARLDFILLAMDQIINNAAKWNTMFAGAMSVPITIRLLVGRGWGQGPTHCQSLQANFAHIPGLKVVMPSFPEDVYGLLLSSIFDNNPVIFIEHRWLHNIVCDTNPYDFVPLGKARTVVNGSDITVVSMSYMTIEALHAIKFLQERGVNCDLIDLRTVKPIDWETIYKSINRTGKLLVLDTGFEFCSIASEIISKVSMDCFNNLNIAPRRLAMPDVSVPTSYILANSLYTYSENIASEICKMLKVDIDTQPLKNKRDNFPRDTPGDWFEGPF
ncbi:MAG: acetoin dehydrogenase [Gammaproteobacteria bacterium RIFCSPHIGHO2_12_FULL_35_23]|nr:MAG: acetoin dehydrogenase [Gammaproteobacteria bacterium RIFCSPHIGHO2_12_FULL_35_23]